MDSTWLITGMFAGLTVFLVVYGIKAPITAPPARDWSDPLRGGLVEDGWETADPTDPANSGGLFTGFLMPLVRNFIPQTPLAAQLKSHHRDAINELLVRSGNPWRVTPEEFQGIRILATGAGAVAFLVLAMASILPFPPLVAMPFGGVVGFLIPKYLLVKAKNNRLRAARHGLPEALDLLRITLNSGQNFLPALGEVADRIPPGLIRDEMTRMYVDMRAGRTMQGALSDFARRVPTPQVESFVRSVLMTERLGSDIAETLRNQADAARRDYEATLDKKVGALPNLMFIPILVFGLPALMTVLLAPAMASIISGLD